MSSNVYYLQCRRKPRWSTAEYIITFQLFFILFERFLIQNGFPNAIIYISDIGNIYLLLNLLMKGHFKRFKSVIVGYVALIVTSALVAVSNWDIYGNNFVFTIFDIRNLLRFLIFFLAVVNFVKAEHVDFIFSFIELHFFINSLFILYLYFTYFPPNAASMRGDLLNGFFGTMRGGNTFVNVEMLVVILYVFSKWTKHAAKFSHVLLAVCVSILIVGLIELKAFFFELIIVYCLYLFFLKKSRKEQICNLVIIGVALFVGFIGVKVMLKEHPWFSDLLSFKGLWAAITARNYSSSDDLNRFTGVFTISKDVFSYDWKKMLFGIGLGNGSTAQYAGKMTAFATKYSKLNYSWFQVTYIFLQCGFVGLVLYFGIFCLFLIIKKSNDFSFFSSMMVVLSLVLVFYDEALKTDAAYFVYFAIAIGFIPHKRVARLSKEEECYCQ